MRGKLLILSIVFLACAAFTCDTCETEGKQSKVILNHCVGVYAPQIMATPCFWDENDRYFCTCEVRECYYRCTKEHTFSDNGTSFKRGE